MYTVLKKTTAQSFLPFRCPENPLIVSFVKLDGQNGGTSLHGCSRFGHWLSQTMETNTPSC